MVDNYNKKKGSEEELKTAKVEVAQDIKRELEASIGVDVPGLPIGINAAFKYKNF